jgi:aldehyde:ferredoxin oxidoreductase
VRAVSYLDDLSYELGLDPIEMGNTLAMLADSTERGVVDAGRAWGDVDRMVELVRETAAGTGLGAHLWHGAAGAARDWVRRSSPCA